MLSSARRRPSSSHAAKQNLIGPRGGQVAPAWRDQARDRRERGGERRKLPPEVGSKILVSNLPDDVSETDVFDLFKSTVGPVKSLFLVYSPSGHSRGIAVVHFHHSESAMKARNAYHGKVIDSTNAIRVELVSDPAAAAVGGPLLARIQGVTGNGTTSEPSRPPSLIDRIPTSTQISKPVPKQQPPRAQFKVGGQQSRPGVQGMRKKGPKRLQNVKKTAEELDAEMDEWRRAT